MKKLLALILACLMLVSLLAGCGSTADTAEEEEATTAAVEEETDEEAVEEGDDAEEAEEDEGFTRFDDLQEITMYVRVWADYEGRTEVFEEINKILEEKINVHVTPTFLSSDFSNQVALALAAGETIDLTMVPWAFSSFTSQNMLMPLNDLLDEYAPWIVENMSEYLPATTIDGNVYSVTVMREMNTSQYLIWRKDIAEELGIEEDMENVDSWSGLHDILMKVYEAQDTLSEDLQTPVVFGSQNGSGGVVAYQGVNWADDLMANNESYDYLGCEYIAVDPETNTVFENITNDTAVAHYNRMYEWYHDGLISKDAATSTEYSDTLMANGQIFCYFSNAEYGAAAAKTNNTGRDLNAKVWTNIGITTSYVSCFSYGVSATSENPEAAVAAMNEFYSNADICNLMVWGIQGRDYEVDDTGCAYRLDGGTYQALEYFQGNQFLTYAPQQEEGSAFRQNQYEDFKSGTISPYFGLVVDNTEIANELTAIKTVFDKYYPTVACGQVKIDDVIDDWKAELDAAGMQTVLDFYQAAVDEFVANK